MMMDTIFYDMDDILITTSSNVNHHHNMVHQILYWLEEHNLYLKPEKCTFEAPEVEYLGVIIGYG